MIHKKSKIYVAGHKGMVGTAICKKLSFEGYSNLIYKSSSSLDLTNQTAVYQFIKKEKPQIIINAAAKVGGILANMNFPYEFLMKNMQIQNNLINAAFLNGIDKFIFLGSSCIYPKFASQPIKEEYLLTDSLESTNQWYAIAKISGVKLCESLRKQYKKDYISLMPTNLYGYNDNFDLESSHVLPALIRKFHDAKLNERENVELWGSGKPKREFLFVDDLADAILFCIENKLDESLYNVGVGKDISIIELAKLIQKIVGYKGTISWDLSKPDGTPKKLLDTSKMNKLGWSHSTKLENGIKLTYDWFLNNINNYKKNKL